jgi:pyruvate dehydrogenase E2 component (dihydrolipoamide acetyltransferase)
MQFRVPELGEGIDQATVIDVMVKPGDTVRAGQEVVEVETEKASMGVPISTAGTVGKVLVKRGDKVSVGTPLLELTTEAASDGKKKEPVQPKSNAAEKPAEEKPKAIAPAESHDGAPKSVEFHLPELGEGVDSGTVVGISVKPGQAIAAEQTLIEVETEKATIPVPSNVAGKVESIKVRVGQKVSTGSLVAVIQADAAAPAAKPVAKQPPKSEAKPATKPVEADGHQGSPAPIPALSRPVARRVARNGQSETVPAGPATRRLARELGVDLQEVTGSAPGGRVTQDDIKAFVRGLPKRPTAGQLGAATGIPIPALPDFSKFGPIERKPFTGLRKAIAKNLSLAWSIAPQVTQHDLADVTELEASRKRALERAGKDSPKITMTVLAVKACVAALKAFPHFNSSYDANAGENGELILKGYYHIGIAVDTERGLVVPVIRDADKKSVHELAKEMTELAEKARSGKLALDEMRGGTFTITNLGGIGGTAFSPIINYPEVAILGLSKSSWQPVVRDNKIEPRLMLPLSVTYDHRVIDGADGARFTAWLAYWFADPGRTLMES